MSDLKRCLEQAPSRLSVVSTSASENQTLQTSPPQEPNNIGPPLSSASTRSTVPFIEPLQLMLPGPEIKAPPETPVLPSPGPSTLVEKPTSTTFSPPTSAPVSSSRYPPPLDLSILEARKIVEGANGTIIIEELDTPAIRRAKNLRRREERRQEMLRRDSLAAAMAENTSASAPASIGPPVVSGEISSKPTKGAGADSELSSLSEYGSELTDESGKPKQTKKRGRKRKSSAAASAILVPKKSDRDDLATVLLGNREMLEGGTLGTSFSPLCKSITGNKLIHCV